MTTPYIQGSAAVPEATALLLRGIQVDAFGEIKGGHRSLIDPLQQGLTGKPITNSTLPDMLPGAPSLTVTAGFTNAAVENIETAKGFDFSSATTDNGELIRPGDRSVSAYNLLNYGSEPSVVIAVWATVDALPPGPNVIAGYAHQTGAACQWVIQVDNIGVRPMMQGNFGLIATPTAVVALNTPILYTFFAKRTGAGAFDRRSYINSTLHHAEARTYPFFNPTTGNAAAQPAFGGATGFSYAWDGHLHRAQAFKVPADFDIDAWIAQEIALNSTRFV
jgi:hypothetical protein